MSYNIRASRLWGYWKVRIQKPRAAKMAIPAKEEAIELSELKPIYLGPIELSGRKLNRWKGGREQLLQLGKFLWIEGGERKGLDFLEFLWDQFDRPSLAEELGHNSEANSLHNIKWVNLLDVGLLLLAAFFK